MPKPSSQIYSQKANSINISIPKLSKSQKSKWRSRHPIEIERVMHESFEKKEIEDAKKSLEIRCVMSPGPPFASKIEPKNSLKREPKQK